MTQQLSQEVILQSLQKVIDPDLHRDIVSLGFVKDLQISEAGQVAITIELTTPACPFKAQMKEKAEQSILEVPGVKEAVVNMTYRVRASAAPQGSFLPGVKNVIAVASGKGGVGKSTVSANLALALAQSGAQVGLMDADIYGPSIPALLGIDDPHVEGDESRMYPMVKYGLKVISMGFFLPAGEAVIWRGPMLDKMVTQFLSNVDWGTLDYLVIDLPPGTGDVQLGLCQKVSIAGAVVVSTPQDIALNVAQKAIAMFNKLNCPILGMVENMSYYVCGQCGHHDYIFGKGGARKMADKVGIPFLGEIPLAVNIRTSSDEGVPIVIAEQQSDQAQAFTKIAQNVAAQLSIRNVTGE